MVGLTAHIHAPVTAPKQRFKHLRLSHSSHQWNSSMPRSPAVALLLALIVGGTSLTAVDQPAPSTPVTTTAGVPLPAGWGLHIADHFGTAGNVGTVAQLHAKYREGQFYNADQNGLVKIPNVVINKEQQTYVHFEQAVVFAADHMSIQGRGHPDGSITSAELVSEYKARSWCVEARYQIPSADKSWPAFWTYGATVPHDSSEFDFEQPITPTQGVHDVSLHNHPGATDMVIADPKFTTKWMTWHDGAFDASTAAHSYTILYDDATKTVERHIDGKLIYRATFTLNASMGGTGHGPDACTIINLAVGGSWPGNVADPKSYSGDLDVYSIDYYGPAVTK